MCADCAITLPKPKVSFINWSTPMSALLCVMTKQRSPLLFTIKDPSPSVNPINQIKNIFVGKAFPGKYAENLR